MKKIFYLSLVFFFLASIYSFAQTSVNAGPEQKVKTEIKFPSAVRPGSEFTMEIKITKGSISGLARFQQYLPTGMTATASKNDGADFTFENQYVKFIWVALPEQGTLTMKYKVTVDASMSSSKTLSGTFSYVENGRTKTHSIVPKEISIDPKAPVEEAVVSEPEVKREPPKGEAAPVMVEPAQETVAPPAEETKTETPPPSGSNPANEPVAAQPSIEIPEKKAPETSPEKVNVAENVSVNKTPPPPKSNPMTMASATGIVFRVQIAAMNEKHFRKDGYFQTKFGITQYVYTEEHEGLKKYCVGNYSTYNEARTLRDEISGSANGSFVVAYKDGIRVSVVEAMQAIKQK